MFLLITWKQQCASLERKSCPSLLIIGELTLEYLGWLYSISEA